MIVLLTPVIFIALLFKDEMNSLSEEDLCKLFGQENEDCKMTMNRLRMPGQEPVLFKVFQNFLSLQLQKYYPKFNLKID